MDLINSMTDEVFMNVEPVERPNQNVNAQRPIPKKMEMLENQMQKNQK